MLSWDDVASTTRARTRTPERPRRASGTRSAHEEQLGVLPWSQRRSRLPRDHREEGRERGSRTTGTSTGAREGREEAKGRAHGAPRRVPQFGKTRRSSRGRTLRFAPRVHEEDQGLRGAAGDAVEKLKPHREAFGHNIPRKDTRASATRRLAQARAGGARGEDGRHITDRDRAAGHLQSWSTTRASPDWSS